MLQIIAYFGVGMYPTTPTTIIGGVSITVTASTTSFLCTSAIKTRFVGDPLNSTDPTLMIPIVSLILASSQCRPVTYASPANTTTPSTFSKLPGRKSIKVISTIVESAFELNHLLPLPVHLNLREPDII